MSPRKKLFLHLVCQKCISECMFSIKTEKYILCRPTPHVKVSISVNKSNTHSLRWHIAHTLTHNSLFICRLSSYPKSSLELPVFLRVSVKCIHMFLRGLRLEGDCFCSDKNHLAPSEEPANAAQDGTE